MSQQLKDVLSNWGFDSNVTIEVENISYETEREVHIWTVNNDFILKMTQSKGEVQNNITLSTLLKKANIPAQRVMITKDGKPYVEAGDKYYTLFTKIKGDVLKGYFDGDYLSRGAYLGACIAKLHQGLNSITTDLIENHKIWDNNMIEELNGWVETEINHYMEQNLEHAQTLNHIKNELNQNFKSLYKTLPRQAIHRDMHGENMIFNEGELVGYIDFDLSQINARIFDLCYLGTGSLAGVFNDKDTLEKWLPFMRAVVTGYDRENSLILEEMQSLKYMMIAIELIMIAYFAKEGYDDIAHTNVKMVNYINEVWGEF